MSVRRRSCVMNMNTKTDNGKKKGYNLSKNAKAIPLYKDKNMNYLLAFFSSETPMK